MTTMTHATRWAALCRREWLDLRRRGWRLVVMVGALWVLGQYFGLCYVKQMSLPYPLWVYTKFPPGDVQRGDYVVVELPPAVAGVYPPGSTFIKQIAGLPGDRVEARFTGQIENGIYTVWHGADATVVGAAKRVGRKGKALVPGPQGIIPRGRVFIAGTHPDSLDSRYAMMGWVETSRIIGQAWPVSPAPFARLWVGMGWSEE